MSKLINGELHTRESALEAHKGLVHRECHKIKARAKALGHDYEDMESIGFIGMIKAFDRFDSERNVRFSTFAVPYIWGELERSLIKSNQGLYYPKHIKEIAYKIWRSKTVDLSAEEIAKAVGESVENVKYALDFMGNANPVHLETEMEESENGISYYIGVADDNSGMFVKEFIDTLTDLEKVVITNLMLGITMSDIARSLGFTPQYISQIRKVMAGKYLKFSSGKNVRGARV